MTVQSLRHFLLEYIQMFPEQTIAERRDSRLYPLITGRMNGQITFGIKSQTTIAHVRRADAHGGIIYDTNLAVHTDATFLHVRHTRIVQRKPVMAINGAKTFEHPPPQDIHRMLLQPSIA